MREPEAFAAASQIQAITLEEIFERFSSWLRLKNLIAWILSYREKLRDAIRRRREKRESRMNEVINPLSVDEIKCAEIEIVRCVQATSFREELSCLSESKGDNATYYFLSEELCLQ